MLRSQTLPHPRSQSFRPQSIRPVLGDEPMSVMVFLPKSRCSSRICSCCARRAEDIPLDAAVEGLDEGVVCGLSRPAQRNAMGIGQIARDELRSLIDTDGVGIPRPGPDPFQCRYQVFTPIAEPRISQRRELREDINHRQTRISFPKASWSCTSPWPRSG